MRRFVSAAVLGVLGLGATGCDMPLEMAMSDEHLMAPMRDTCYTGDECLEQAWDLVSEAGVKVKKFKRREQGMTWGDTIFLPAEWQTMSPGMQALYLRHEMVHVRQFRAMGKAKFVATYADERKRWGLEMQAYRQMMRDDACSPENIVLEEAHQAFIDQMSFELANLYGFVTLDKGDLEDLTHDLLTDESERWDSYVYCRMTPEQKAEVDAWNDRELPAHRHESEQ